MNAQQTAKVREDKRWIMVKAPNDHVILPHDSIDGPCLSHRGVVMAPRLACNIPGAVGTFAAHYNTTGHQVWTGKMMTVRNGKIVRKEAA